MLDHCTHWLGFTMGVLGYIPGRGYSATWAIRGRAAGHGMVFWSRCPKQGIQFDLPLS